MTDLLTTGDEFADDTAYDGETFTDDYTGPAPLFTGDVGQLSVPVRETLVTLLKRRYIDAHRHAHDWRIVLDNEDALRTRLNDLFLDLVIDRDYQVAYKRQALSETGNPFPTLLYDQRYNREETILLVFLRRLIRSTQQSGDDTVFVDRADMVEEVATFRPSSATNHAQDRRAANAAVDSLIRNDLLLRTPEPDRYRVSPVIEVLLPVEKVQALGAWLHEQNTGTSDTSGIGASSADSPDSTGSPDGTDGTGSADSGNDTQGDFE